MRHTTFSAREVAEAALQIASEICVYTNAQRQVLEIPRDGT